MHRCSRSHWAWLSHWLLRVLLAAHVLSRRSLSHSLSTSVELLHSWEVLEDLGEKGVNLGLVKKINCVAKILLLEVLEIRLVMEFFILSLSDFLDLVVVNVELLSIEVVLMEFSLGL
jgi:hypothetical protein